MVERNEFGDVVWVYMGLDWCFNISRIILTAIDGVHAYGRDIWIQNVCLYCNRRCLFCFRAYHLVLNAYSDRLFLNA